MKSIFITLLALVISTQTFAFTFKYDRCAGYGYPGYYYNSTNGDYGYRDNTRAYKECTRYYEEHSFFVESYRSYTCSDTDFMGSYTLDVTGDPDKIKIRQSLTWVAPDYKIYEQQDRAVLVTKTASGGLALIGTCYLNK